MSKAKQQDKKACESVTLARTACSVTIIIAVLILSNRPFKFHVTCDFMSQSAKVHRHHWEEAC